MGDKVMKYGYFDDSRREYVITTPKTPLPWINYLGSEEFLGMISNTLGGYCFYRDAKLQRLLRYRYNGVPGDIGGRFYYIKEKGKPAWDIPYLIPRKMHFGCRLHFLSHWGRIVRSMIWCLPMRAAR